MFERNRAERISCPDCALAQWLPPLAPGQIAQCIQCDKVLTRRNRGGIDVPLTLGITALLLFIPANLAPLMSVTERGAQRENWLSTGVATLWSGGFELLAVLVAAFTIAIPFTYLTLLVVVLGSIRFGGQPRLGRLFRWTEHMRPWMMVEVYLVGSCVAYSRLQKIAFVNVGLGGWCLMASAFVLLLFAAKLDERRVWDALGPRRALAPGTATINCIACELPVPQAHAGERCPRCEAVLHDRKPYALHRTAALVIAGFALLIPANLLPILTIEQLGSIDPNTILGGVRELVRAGLWPLAVLVFVASIVIPLMKLFGLTWMLLLTHQRSDRYLVARTRLYRVIDLIGRWSNIDVFMLSILVALVQFGVLSQVRAEYGAIAFAAVVVVTMIASRAFDSRLMWDAARNNA
ncbi:MAG TPA: PqiA/YebS family transporter subunit [Steroidobacteraceae bacterium]|jgi:paraquat-inducible protein A|nr:PqiA/YebS family transporter subunit [Steroidobacteraceae bacterium]